VSVLPFLVLLVSLQRILELQIANSNTAHLKRRGAVEFGAAHYPLMVALHTAWLCSTLVEWWWGEPTSLSFLSFLGWAFLLVGQALRLLTIKTLGRRWTTRVIVLRNEPLVTAGLFKYVPHPNYLGVCLEIFGLPLIGGCWKTSLLFGCLNLVLLRRRITIEDRALRGNGV